MKILFNHYKHLTEVLFPRLAVEYNWDLVYDKQIQHALCNYLGIKPPWHPCRASIHPRDLKRLVRLCREIENDPTKFDVVVNV